MRIIHFQSPDEPLARISSLPAAFRSRSGRRSNRSRSCPESVPDSDRRSAARIRHWHRPEGPACPRSQIRWPWLRSARGTSLAFPQRLLRLLALGDVKAESHQAANPSPGCRDTALWPREHPVSSWPSASNTQAPSRAHLTDPSGKYFLIFLFAVLGGLFSGGKRSRSERCPAVWYGFSLPTIVFGLGPGWRPSKNGCPGL